jgi:hypothetical protein
LHLASTRKFNRLNQPWDATFSLRHLGDETAMRRDWRADAKSSGDWFVHEINERRPLRCALGGFDVLIRGVRDGCEMNLRITDEPLHDNGIDLDRHHHAPFTLPLPPAALPLGSAATGGAIRQAVKHGASTQAKP